MKITRDYAISETERKAVYKLLHGNRFKGREQEEEFEREWCKYFGRKYAIAVNTGTAGLHSSLLACGVGPGKEVITVPNTCSCVLVSIMYTGAKPVFCDIDEDTMNIDVTKIKDKITSKTKVIMPISIVGHPVDFDPIVDLAKDHHLYIVSDMAQALGSKYKGKYGDTYGDLSVSSLGIGKHLTSAGRVGIVSTDNEELAEAVHQYSHKGEGISFRSDPKYVIRGSFDKLGYRYLPSQLHCAIARIQLKRFMTGSLGPERRRRIANHYRELLTDKFPEIMTPIEKEWAYHTYLSYVIKIKTPTRDDLYDFLTRRDIGVSVLYQALLHHYRLYTRKYGNQKCPVAERVTREVLALPVWPTMTSRQVEYVVKSIGDFKKHS